jgi:adenylate kinase family enzyme
MRTVILGNSGSGKSTLARKLAAADGRPMLDLDTLVWEPGRIAVPRNPTAVQQDLLAWLDARPAWIIEGCYGDLIAAALTQQPELIFLNPGAAVCRRHCESRPLEPHKYATKAEQDEKLAFLLDWVSDYYHRDGPLSLRGHRAVFDDYAGPKRELTVVPD